MLFQVAYDDNDLDEELSKVMGDVDEDEEEDEDDREVKEATEKR